MLLARPLSLRATSFDVTNGLGESVARLELSPGFDGGALTCAGKRHRISREAGGGAWLLHDGEQVVFEAHPPPAIKNRLLFTVKGAILEIAGEGTGLRRFNVVGPDWAQLGSIRRSGFLGRRLVADLSDLVPELAQLFLLFCALAIARRLHAG